MKNIIILLALSLLSFSCQRENSEKIIAKWQHERTITQSDTVDVVASNTYNTFRDDSTLYITNGKQDINLRYFVKENTLYSFLLNSQDTSVMDILEISDEYLSLRIAPSFEGADTIILKYKKVKS